MKDPIDLNPEDRRRAASQRAFEKSVSGIIKNFRINFKLMAEALEFGYASDGKGGLRELEKSDIEGYFSEVVKFAGYVKVWEQETDPVKKAYISKYIISMGGIQNELQEIGIELRAALKVDARVTNLDIDQFDKGNVANFRHLLKSSNLISKMLRDWFGPEN